jgi:drug/metabolite transporter (DMT)-like permease
VVAVIGLAVRDVATRRVPKTIASMQLATYGFATIIPAGLLMTALDPAGFVPPSPLDLAQIAGALLFGTGGYYALIAAMRLGEVSVITPFRYTRLIFALIIGWAVFSESVDRYTLIGGAVIVGSGLYTAGPAAGAASSLTYRDAAFLPLCALFARRPRGYRERDFFSHPVRGPT